MMTFRPSGSSLEATVPAGSERDKCPVHGAVGSAGEQAHVGRNAHTPKGRTAQSETDNGEFQPLNLDW